jgi:signal transduction histidine kinase
MSATRSPLSNYWSDRIDHAIETIRDEGSSTHHCAKALALEATRTGQALYRLYAAALNALAAMFAEQAAELPELERLLQAFTDAQDTRGQRVVAVALVGAYRRDGNIAAAYAAVHAQLVPLLAGEPSHSRLLAANVCGVTAQEFGTTDEALRYFYLALDDAKALGLKGRCAHVSANIGELLYMCGNADEGEQVLEAASSWVKECNERWVGPFTHVILALCKLAKNDPVAALAVLRPHFVLDPELLSPSGSGRAFFLATSAYALTENGELELAELFCKQAHAAILGLSDRQLRPYAWWASGHLYHRQGRLDAAIADLRTAVTEVGDIGYVFMPMRATLELAEIHAERGEWELAYREHQRHLALYNRVQSEASRTRLQLVQMQGALREAEVSARREQELGELKNRFLAMASHEFRTPITAIQSATEVLLHYHDELPPAERSEIINDIQRAVHRLRTTMEQVLTLSRADAGRLVFNPRKVTLAPWCRELIQELAHTHGRSHIRLEVGAGCDTLVVSVDTELLQQAVGNLVTNAIKYSSPGQPIVVTLAAEPKHWTMAVRDTGIGIPDADQARLFDSFHRASNTVAIQGTGLGLAIVKRAVDAHGGSVSFVSEVGRGSTFTIRVPA